MEDQETEESTMSPLMQVYLKIKLGKLLESLKNNGVGGSGEGGAEPPTPPHTPQRDGAHSAPSDGGAGRLQPPPQVLEPLQQQALQARVSTGRAFSRDKGPVSASSRASGLC
nr:uncharacterized protein LOC113826909 [Penaeus vannamei]